VRQQRFSRENGSAESVLTAEDVVLGTDNRLSMQRASLEMVSSDGRVKARAERVSTDGSEQGIAELDGGVEVRVNEFCVRTQSATWMPESKQVVGAGPVTVTGNGMTLRGGRFVVNVDTRRVVAYNVSGSIRFDHISGGIG